jgi:hypothetical protein
MSFWILREVENGNLIQYNRNSKQISLVYFHFMTVCFLQRENMNKMILVSTKKTLALLTVDADTRSFTQTKICQQNKTEIWDSHDGDYNEDWPLGYDAM